MDVLINGEIVLYGTCGAQFLPDIGFFTDLDVAAALATIGAGDVRVRINSGGGYSDQGVAIFNLLKGHDGKVHVLVDGVAASAGSVIAMAGDTITMKQGAIMMVHNSQSLSVGNVKDHEKTIEALQATDDAMADIYAARTGRPRAEIVKEMAEETWMTADFAVAKKYATSVEASASMRAAAFDYRLYNHAPERMVALATMLAGDWTPAPPRPTPDEPPHAKFWQFVKSHAKAATALAASFDAEFNGHRLASNIAFAEIWNAAQSGVAADWTPKGELVAVEPASIVQAEAIRREMTEVAAACAMMGKPERAVAFIRSGSTSKAAVATLQAERVAAQEEMNAHATGMSHAAAGAGGTDRHEIARSWANVIDKVNRQHMQRGAEIYSARKANREGFGK